MKRYFVIILYFSIVTSAFSQSELSTFLPTSASQSLQGSMIAFPVDASITIFNPAALAMFVNDQVLLNINHRSQIDFLGFTRFFPPNLGVGVNLMPHSASFPGSSLMSLGAGYRLNASVALGGNLNLMKADSGATFSSASLGLFFRASPRYQFQEKKETSFWNFFHSGTLIQRFSAAIVFHNLPLSGTGKQHQLRVGIAYKPFNYDYFINFAWHLKNGGSDILFGSSVKIIKNVDLLLGVKNFEFKKTMIGFCSRFSDAKFDVSYDLEQNLLNFSLGLVFVPDAKTQAQFYRNIGTRFVKDNDIFEGLKAYKKALAYDPEDETINLVVSVLEEKVDQKQKAIDSLFAIGEKFEKKEWYVTALQAYRQVLSINPRHKATLERLKSLAPKLSNYLEELYTRGVGYYQKNDIKQAESMFSKILEVNANHPGAAKYMAKIDSIKTYTFSEYYYRGLGYFNQRRYNRAIEEFTKALALNPNDKEARRYKKLAEDRLAENKSRVQKLLREAERLERKNQFLKAYNRYRQVLEIEENNKKALDKVQYLRRYISAVVESKFQNARKLFNKGEWQKAINAFSEILSIDPGHRKARSYLRRSKNELKNMLEEHLSLAKKYFEQKNFEKALEECNTILSIDANHAEAQKLQSQAYASISIKNLHNKGKSAFDKGDFLKARRIYQEILTQKPDDEVARKFLNQCESKLKDRIEQLFNDGMVSYSEGDYNSAIQVWNKILAIDPNHKSTKEYIKKATERLEALNRIKEKD